MCWHSIANLQPQSDHGPQGGGGGGGYSDTVWYMCRLGAYFWFKFLNYIIFFFFGGGGGGVEILIFLGEWKFVGIFGGATTKLD